MNVSVIIATLNSGKFIRQALDSIAQQSHPVKEVIIADGGSIDQTLEIVGAYSFTRIVRQMGKGLPDAWNTGVDQCSAELIAFLDSDDYWTVDKIKKQVAVLDQDSEIDAVIGHVKFFLEPGTDCPRNFRPQLLEGTQEAPMPGALLIRKTAYFRIGSFNTDHPIACDIDWFARLRDLKIATATLPDLIIHKRIHNSNLSLSPEYQAGYRQELAHLLFKKRKRQTSDANASISS